MAGRLRRDVPKTRRPSSAQTHISATHDKRRWQLELNPEAPALLWPAAASDPQMTLMMEPS